MICLSKLASSPKPRFPHGRFTSTSTESLSRTAPLSSTSKLRNPKSLGGRKTDSFGWAKLSSRLFSSTTSQDLDEIIVEAPPVSSEPNSGWLAHLPESGKPIELRFPDEIETQFALVEANQGNRHMRYDLVTLCLRSIRMPMSQDFARTSVLLDLCHKSLLIVSQAQKFQEQLKAQLARHITPVQRLDIKVKIGEHKSKLIKSNWSNVPLMAAYAHYLMLDSQLSLACEVVAKALLLTQSNYYFQLAIDAERQENPNLEEAALMYCRSISKNPLSSASLTNLALLEWYHNIDTIKAVQQIEDEIIKANPLPKGYNPPKKKPYERNLQFIEKRTVELLNKAIAADISQENFIAHYHLAFVYETSIGDATKAREHYSRALEINPDHMHSHSNLGSLLMDEKLYDKALHHYEQAKLLAPDQVLVYLNLANCLGRKGSIEAAVKEMQKAIRREPSMPHLHYHLGMILTRARHLEEAVASFERALQLHSIYPNHEFDPAPTYNTMISILRELAGGTIANGESIPEFEIAGQQLARCLDLLPEQSNLISTILTNLSYCFMKSNRPDAALEALQDAEQRFGENFAEAFRHVQQSDENPVVYTQLEEHITNLEQTEAMIRYLLENPETQERSSGADLDELEPHKKTKTKTSGIKKKKSLKKKSKPSKTSLKKSRSSEPSSAQSTAATPHEQDIIRELEETEAVRHLDRQKNVQELEDDLHDTELADQDIDPSPEDSQLETLLTYKARLHYNISFCMSYLGELEETKRHLQLAIESDPHCTSDYIVTEEQMMQKRAMEEGEDDHELEEGATSSTSSRMSPSTHTGSQSQAEVEDADEISDLYDIDDDPPEMTKKRTKKTKQKFIIPPIRKEPVTSNSIRKASRVKLYTPEGMMMQLDALMHPKDGSKPTEATATLLQFLEECKEKAANVDMQALEKQLAGTPRTMSKAVRTAKSRRRKDLKYSISASKRAKSVGFDDGFDSPL